MKSISEIDNTLSSIKPILAKRFFVDKIGYFGSYARNEQSASSDLDILVSLNRPLGWEYFELQEFLEKELGLKVDLVTEKALRAQFKDSILAQVKFI